MKFVLLTFALFGSFILFAQNDADSQNLKYTDTIFFKDGSFKVIKEKDPEKLKKMVFKIWSCNDKEGKCPYNNKDVDRLVIKSDNSKTRKGNKSLKTDYLIITPLNFTKVFVKPIRKAQIFTLPQLAYKGTNYDYYEGTLIAAGHQDFAILTKPDSRDVVAIIATKYYIGGIVFNYKYLLDRAEKMFTNPDPIKKSRKDKEYKNDNYNPYKVMDNAGQIIQGKLFFLN
jgi:hypothetical protein